MSFVTLFSHPYAPLLQFDGGCLEATDNLKGEVIFLISKPAARISW